MFRWMQTTWVVWSAAAAVLVFAASCSDDSSSGAPTSTATPDAGDAATAKETPDYGKAFPQDRVPRLDIKVSEENWQAIVADMTDMLGEFGKGGMPGGDGGGFPPGMDGGFPPGMDGGFPPGMDGGFPPGMDGGFPPGMDGGFPPGMDGGGPPGMDGGDPGGGGMTDLVPRTPVYVECEVSTEDRQLKHVGIRLKGNSSLAMAWTQGIWKLPLRLTFDTFEDKWPETKDQRLYGFRALSLSNGMSDMSLLRDKIGTDIFGVAGLPVPATAFYRVYIDNGQGPVYFGLYTAIELPDDNSFLNTHFGGNDGNIYKPDGVGARWQTYDTATLGKENHQSAADYSDTKALYDALHADRSDAAAWRKELEAHLNVSGFLHWLALNTVIQDWDSYGVMTHNYYLYSDPKNGDQFTWIPWDHSYAFTSDRALSLGMSEVGEGWPLIRFLLDDAEYNAQYRAFLAQAIEKEYETQAISAKFQAAHDLIKPYVVGTEGEITGHTFLSSPTAFDDALAALLTHANNRPKEVAQFLAK